MNSFEEIYSEAMKLAGSDFGDDPEIIQLQNKMKNASRENLGTLLVGSLMLSELSAQRDAQAAVHADAIQPALSAQDMPPAQGPEPPTVAQAASGMSPLLNAPDKLDPGAVQLPEPAAKKAFLHRVSDMLKNPKYIVILILLALLAAMLCVLILDLTGMVNIQLPDLPSAAGVSQTLSGIINQT